MRFLHKFEKIGTLVPLIAMENKHQRILTYLLEDFNRISSLLDVQKDAPPIPRNFSLTAGTSTGPAERFLSCFCFQINT